MTMQNIAISDNDDKNDLKKSGVDACVFGCSFVIVSLCVLIVAVFINGFLPEPVNDKGATESANTFVVSRAFRDLQELSSIGPRVVGTYENDVVAVQFFINQILNVTKTSTEKNRISYDIQKPSGCFSLNLKNFGRGMCYDNVINIIVKLEPVESVEETILLNCHFDSVPTSPGTSDDGLNCAVLLEILRVLAKSPKSLKKNVIFLFNGAEEAGLLASHGFITQHDWAKNISVFINLESCGAGGREVLFQTGPKAYILPAVYANSVPYPHGSVIGEELFQSGVLPSDTDFRIFRDFGHLKGLDFAHYQNGYVYHTSNDNIMQVSENVIHHTGSNILALVNALLEFDNLKGAIAENDNKAVFFDLFGFFMVCYSIEIATYINIIVLILSLLTIFGSLHFIFKNDSLWSILYHVSINFFFLVIEVVAVSCILYSLAALLKWRNLIMLWFSNQWFVITFYGTAVLYVSTSVIKLRRLFLLSKLSDEEEAKLFIITTQIINTLLLSAGIILNIRSVYVISIMLAFLSLSHLLHSIGVLRNSTVGIKLIVYVIFNLIPALYSAYLCIQLYTLIIPMMGRIGIKKDSELYIWIITQFTMFSIFANFIPLVLMVKNWWKIQLSVGILYALYVLIILLHLFEYPLSMKYGQSYSDACPQRFSIMHVGRKFFDANGSIIDDSGYLLTPMDRRSTYSMDLILEHRRFDEVESFCDNDVNCAMPTMYPSFMGDVNSSYWHKAGKPVFSSKKEIRYNITNEENFKTYSLELKGPSLNDVIIIPLNNAKLVTWSSFEDMKENNYDGSWLFARRWSGFESPNPWSFFVTIDVSNIPQNASIFKLIWSAHYVLNNTDHYTNSFKGVLKEFPLWAKVVSWVTDYEEYLFH